MISGLLVEPIDALLSKAGRSRMNNKNAEPTNSLQLSSRQVEAICRNLWLYDPLFEAQGIQAHGGGCAAALVARDLEATLLLPVCPTCDRRMPPRYYRLYPNHLCSKLPRLAES
jgi:hypothetical protein